MSTRIGMLVPSSNTAAEPLTMEMLRDVPRVSLHVARFRVTRLDTSEEALAQFQAAPLLEAASMLADAHMHAICLNATASCYTGMAGDRGLLPLLPQPAETAMLALLEALRIKGARRIGLVTPFLHDVQAATIRVLAEEGLEVVAEHHFNDPGNYTFARFTEADADYSRFFAPSSRAAHAMFDLPDFIGMRLQKAGVGRFENLGLDTYADPARFFSYRRTTHLGEPDYGRLVSAIALV
jgi:maleate cis-trans isomerase